MWAILLVFLTANDEMISYKVNNRFIFETQAQCEAHFAKDKQRMSAQALIFGTSDNFEFYCADVTKNTDVARSLGLLST